MYLSWDVLGVVLILALACALHGCAEATAIDNQCQSYMNGESLPGAALLRLGYRNISILKREPHAEENQTIEPFVRRLFHNHAILKEFVQDLTKELQSGELWESETESMFRYWELDRKLQIEHGDHLARGWVNRSSEFRQFLDSERCHHLKGRYAMVSPGVNPAVGELLRRISKSSSPKPTLFTGCAGTSTSLHFDSARNFFLQLNGTKRFIFLPPCELKNIYLPPTGHPYYRQSSIEPWDLRKVDWSRYPRMNLTANHSVIVADLGPGDLVLVPEFWSHFVVSTSDDSLGMAIRWPFDDRVKNALQLLPIPFETNWSFNEKVKAAFSYVRNLLSYDEDMVNQLVDRWRYAFSSWTVSNELQTLQEQLKENKTQLDEQRLQKFSKYSRRVQDTLLEIVPNADIRDQLLLDYCDDVILTLFSPKEAVWFTLNALNSGIDI